MLWSSLLIVLLAELLSVEGAGDAALAFRFRDVVDVVFLFKRWLVAEYEMVESTVGALEVFSMKVSALVAVTIWVRSLIADFFVFDVFVACSGLLDHWVVNPELGTCSHLYSVFLSVSCVNNCLQWFRWAWLWVLAHVVWIVLSF